jgi:hypothetical protein
MKNYDVIVVGSGSAGIGAALAAARNGAATLLVEKNGFPGGLGTAGLISHFDNMKMLGVTGIAMELYNELRKRGALKEFDVSGFDMPYSFWQGGCGFDPEELKALILDLLKEAGVELLFHSLVTETVVNRDRIEGIVLYNKSGRKTVTGKVVIDATGDADVACQAGAGYELGDGNGECMSPTLSFLIGGVNTERLLEYFDEHPDQIGNHPRLGKYIKDHRRSIIIQGFYDLIRKAREAGDLDIQLPEPGIGLILQPRYGVYHVNATRVPGINPVDGESLSLLETRERENVRELFRFMKKYIPGFEDSYIMQTALQAGIRESRRIAGEYCLDIEDIRGRKKFGDSVVKSMLGHTDVHSGKDMKWSFEFIDGPYYIPYRALVPKKVDNLLVAGRCISVTREALASIRIMPVCTGTGEAAGTAAALSAGEGCTPRKLNVGLLQERLVKNGVEL